MAGQRQPIGLVQANGRKHLTKEEIRRRTAEEVQPCTDGIEAPGYLTATQKKQFNKIAGQLQKIKIMGETDVDALARYITAQSLYEAAVKELRKLEKERPTDRKEDGYYIAMELWHKSAELADKRQDRYFKQDIWKTSWKVTGLRLMHLLLRSRLQPVLARTERVHIITRQAAWLRRRRV